MTKTEYLDQICIALGIDISLFPDRLLSTYLSAIATHLGVDISALEGCTLPQWLEAIRDNAGNIGGGGLTEMKIIEIEDFDGRYYKAIVGQSVGSWVELFGYDGGFEVRDNVVYYNGNATKSLATDLITEDFKFEMVILFPIYVDYDNREKKSYPIEDGMTFAAFCESEGNTDGYYINSDGYLCDKNGYLVVSTDFGEGSWYPQRGIDAFTAEYCEDYGGMEWYAILPDKDVVMFTVAYNTKFAPKGSTWEQFGANTFYSGWDIEVTADGVKYNGSDVKYNGVNVQGTDAIIDGAEYDVAW